MVLAFFCVALSVHAQNVGTVGTGYVRTDVPERLLAQASMLYNEGSYDVAEVMLRAVVDADATDEQRREAAAMLVLIAYHRDPATAGDAIERYLREYPDAPQLNRMQALALLSAYARGEYNKVTEGMAAVDPDMLGDEERDHLVLAYALSLLEEKRYDEAANQLEILDLISDRYAPEVTYYTAYADLMGKRYDKAELGFTKAMEAAAYHRQSRYYLAEIALATKEYVKAEQQAADYLSSYEGDDLTLEMKRIQGESLYGQSRYLSAAIVLEEYLAEADEPKREVLYQLGMAHFNSGEHLRAPEVLAMVSDGDDVIAQSAQLHAGLSFLSLDDKNKARLCFEQAAAMNASPQLRERAMYNYTVCVHETSYAGFGESVEILERFLNEFPTSAYADRVNSYLVETYMHTKNYDAALQSIAKIKRPSAVVLEAKQKLLFKAGTEAFANGDLKKAVGKFNESMKVGDYSRQTIADALFWRGEAYYRGGNYGQAAKDYSRYLAQTAERQVRTYGLALYGLGYAQFVQKNYREASKQFELLMKSQPAATGIVDKATMADAQMRIGDCLFHARQYNAAEKAYDNAVKMDPSAADYALYQKAFTQGLSGRYTDKIGTLTYLIESYPHSDYLDDALYEKGRAYVQLDNGNQAIQVFEQLTERFPKSQYAPKAGNEIALIHYQNNHIRAAIKAYKAVIVNYPGSEQASVAMRDLKNLYVEENMVDNYVEFASQTKGMAAVNVNEHDSLTYKAAELAYVRGDNDAAAEGFAKYLKQFEHGAYTSDAQYYLGCIYYQRNDYKEARTYLQCVAERPSTKYCEEATRMLADMAYAHKDYDTALSAYDALIELAGVLAVKLHAQVHYLRSANLLGRSDLIIAETGDVLGNSHLDPGMAIELRYYRAKAYLGGSRNDAAVEDLKLLATDTRNIYGAESKYLLAQLYYDTSQYDKAEQEVLDYINVSTPHTYWLARSFVLLSDVYVKKEMYIEAKQYLLSLKQGYQAEDDIEAMIEERMKALEIGQ